MKVEAYVLINGKRDAVLSWNFKSMYDFKEFFVAWLKNAEVKTLNLELRVEKVE